MNEAARWRPGGRSPGWRIAMATGGVLCAGTGVALILWPPLLAYAVAGLLLLLGAVLLVGAGAARGRPGASARAPGGPDPRVR